MNRAKLLGILFALCTLCQAETQYHHGKGQITLQMAPNPILRSVMSSIRPDLGQATKEDNDIIMEIFSVHRYLQSRITVEWIQHNTIKQDASLSGLWDELYSRIIPDKKEITTGLPQSNELLPHHTISITIQKENVTGNPAKRISQVINSTGIKDKILQDMKWETTVLDSIDWESIENSLLCFSRPTRVKYTKLMFGLHQTNDRNNKYYGTTELCPCCNKARETFDHLLECNSPVASESRLK